MIELLQPGSVEIIERGQINIVREIERAQNMMVQVKEMDTSCMSVFSPRKALEGRHGGSRSRREIAGTWALEEIRRRRR